MKLWKKAVSVGLSLAMCAGLVSPALAITYDIGAGSVYVDEGGSWQDGHETYNAGNKSADKDITITQSDSETATTNTITVTGAVAGTIITLKDVNIDVSGDGKAAMSITGNGSQNPEENIAVTVELDGKNTLTSGSSHAGLELNNGASVTIQDKTKEGSDGDRVAVTEDDNAAVLEATGGDYAAGIGGGNSGTAGGITIDGVKGVVGRDGNVISGVIATGGKYAAGIGSGLYGTVADVFDENGKFVSASITIRNSVLKATGGKYAAGIGSGYGGTAGSILIDGAKKVTATGGYLGAGIGSGCRGTVADVFDEDGKLIKDSITINNSTVTAIGGKFAAGIGAGSDGYNSSTGEHYNSTAGNITIEGTSKVTAIVELDSAAIGGYRTNYATAGNITIGDEVTLLALGNTLRYLDRRAVDPWNEDSTVDGNILIGNLSSSSEVSSSTVFFLAVLDERGNPVLVRDEENNLVKFDVKWKDEESKIKTTYYSFAIDLPFEIGTEFVIVQRGADGNFKYLVGKDNLAVYQTKVEVVEENGEKKQIVVPAQGDNLWLRSVTTTYTVKSEDNSKLATTVRKQLLSKYKDSSVKVGDKVEEEGTGMKWVLVDSEQTQVGGIHEDGKLYNNKFVGTWRHEGLDYTVTVDPGNGGEDVELPGKVGDGETKPTLPELTPPSGYTFAGLVDEDEHLLVDEKGNPMANEDGKLIDEDGSPILDGNGNPIDNPFASNYIPGSDGQEIKVKAEWDGYGYEVTVDPDNGDEEITLDGKVGGENNPQKPEDPEKDGYKFTGWVAVDEDGNPIVDEDGNPVDPFDPNFIPDEDGQKIIVKATWTKIPESSTPTTPVIGGGFTPSEIEIDDVAVPLAGIFTRADAIGYLWEQSGSPEWELSDFPDVPEEHRWAVAIGWAQDMGIALPDLEGNFRPDDLVERSVEDIELSPEGELQEFLNRYAVYAGIELDEGELFFVLDGDPDEIIMGEEAQVIFDHFFAKLEAALADLAA